MFGIVSHGAYDVWIIDNVFEGLQDGQGTATAIYTGTTPLAIPYRNHIIGNIFFNNDNNIDFQCNGSRIMQNIVQATSVDVTATVNVRTTLPGNPGDDNIVSDNIFEGDYSNTGGYIAGTHDMWVGNICSDTAETEVGDNGFSVAIPAA